MLDLLAYIEWTVNPEIVNFGPIAVRWYGLLFSSGFAIGYLITQYVFRMEKEPEEWLDILLIIIVFSAILGARLGHVFFYSWDYYQDHLVEIPMIWKGGLASHGGAIGLFIGIYLFSRYVSKRPMLWIMDRIAMSVAFTGCLIRLGNLMNHEIVGATTDVPWGFYFSRYIPPQGVTGGLLPRHPAQLYESLAYLAIAGLLSWMFFKTKAKEKTGLLSGVFFLTVFGARFIIEFFKEVQETFEIGLTLNMGQILSIPLILLGTWLIWRGQTKANSLA